ncbi:MAG: type II toxin-antitoxin system prevent-host-death family antitoxin [bacterium]|nr:type II toxin-antitoxin system prevent-host-death family antitoxin [bacterium]
MQKAEHKLSEIVASALRDGPQRILKVGEDLAVVLSSQEYDRLTQGRETLVEFLRRAPLGRLDLARVPDLPTGADR